MARHRCFARTIEDHPYLAMVSNGDQYPCAIQGRYGVNFFSVSRRWWDPKKRKFSWATDPVTWLRALHDAGLVPKQCGWDPEKIHIGWADRQSARAYRAAAAVARNILEQASLAGLPGCI
jgi:hypothetical protein